MQNINDTESAPEGCTVIQFKSIALSILSGLCAGPEMVCIGDSFCFCQENNLHSALLYNLNIGYVCWV